MLNGPMRNYVVRQVAEHPEWGLKIEGDQVVPVGELEEGEGC
jgi:hypothetical protein